MRFGALATFERKAPSSPLVSMHCPDSLQPGGVTQIFWGQGAYLGREYTATRREASLKPLDRREAKSWSPVVGGRTIAIVSVCMPRLRYQASSLNSIRCSRDNLCTGGGRP